MESSAQSSGRDALTHLVQSLRRKGVQLWRRDGQLHYRAPKGALSSEEIAAIRFAKDRLMELLQFAPLGAATDLELQPCGQRLDVPLGFSQLARWNLVPATREVISRDVAYAARLRGRLDVAALSASVDELVRRHEALRTRIEIVDGVPTQRIAAPERDVLDVQGLVDVPASLHDSRVNECMETLIMQPITLATGPLFGARLIALSEEEHVLTLVTDHMISDRFSMRILVQDLFLAYECAARGDSFALPSLPVQFPDFCIWQRHTLPAWLEKHGAYWNQRLSGTGRVEFPADARSAASTIGWATVPVRIGKELTSELRNWCRTHGTTLTMAIFSAYVALVARWCETSDLVVQYQTSGRTSPVLEDVVGYLACILLLRTELQYDDRFVDVVRRATDEYCTAYEHADGSYLVSQTPRPPYARNTLFNWWPLESGMRTSRADDTPAPLEVTPVPVPNPGQRVFECDHEPEIVLREMEQEVVGGVYFPLNRNSPEGMERFTRNFVLFLQSLASGAPVRIREIALV